MSRSKRRTLIDVVFLLTVFVLTIYAVFHGQDLGELLENLQMADLRIFVIPGILLVLIFIWFEALIFWYLYRMLGITVQMGRCYLYAFIGYFFSCITPSASGGQPAQLFYMRKDRLPVPESTLVLLMDSILYKLVLVMVGVLVFVFRPASIMEALDPVMPWMWLGMGLNVIGITFMILFVIFPVTIHRLLAFVLTLAGKLPFFTLKQSYFDRLDRLMERYQSASNFVTHNRRRIVKAYLMTVVWRFVIFAVTAVTYLSFHLSGTALWEIMVLQCMISLAAEMLPLPGGMGVTEQLFLAVFYPVFGAQFVLPAMVLSRGISYYAQLLISAVMTGVAHFVIGGREDQA